MLDIPTIDDGLCNFRALFKPLSTCGFLKLFDASPMVCFPTLDTDESVNTKSETVLPYFLVNLKKTNSNKMDFFHWDLKEDEYKAVFLNELNSSEERPFEERKLNFLLSSFSNFGLLFF